MKQLQRENSADRVFTVAVVGGGPAGMMAAATAAQINKSKVILVEKNKVLGKKLLITGKGRCNITNFDPNISRFIENYGPNGKFLMSGLNLFGVMETIQFFNTIGVATVRERGNRVFPKYADAGLIVKAFESYLVSAGVYIAKDTTIAGLIIEDKKVKGLKCLQDDIYAENVIVCTGGVSYPKTGSTGDGFAWADNAGHGIIDLAPALVPLKIKDAWVSKIGKLDLKNVKISVYLNEKLKIKKFGDISFLGNGLGGPVTLDLSKDIAGYLKRGVVKLKIDLKPALDHKQLDLRIQREIAKNPNKNFGSTIRQLLPAAFASVIPSITGLDPEKKNNIINRSERKTLVHQLKETQITIKETFDISKGIISSGGINLKEVDPRTMGSKLINNLYFAGEIIDIDGSTGGYNLQVCWTTGYLAGKAAAEVTS